VLRCHRYLTQVHDYTRAKLAAGQAAAAAGDSIAAGGAPPAGAEEARDKTEHFRRKLIEEWCPTAVERITADMEALEMHSAVRNVMRLFDRIKDFEKRVRGRDPELGLANRAALLEALELHAQLLAPLAPHLAEELLEMLGSGEDGAQPPWPGVSLELAA
jgi:leucyl-tRNA synthetase